MRVETLCVGLDVAKKAVAALKEYVSSAFIIYTKQIAHCDVRSIRRILMKNQRTMSSNWRIFEFLQVYGGANIALMLVTNLLISTGE